MGNPFSGDVDGYVAKVNSSGGGTLSYSYLGTAAYDQCYFVQCDNQGDVIFLKLDTQGYEKNILNGAKESLSKIKGIQIELALKPSYNNAPGYKEIIEILEEFGFTLFSLEEGFEDEKTGQLLEIDAIFFR